MRRLVVLLVFLAAFVLPRTGSAYTIQSGFTKSCHERMSVPALTYFLENLSAETEIPLPNGDSWEGATRDVRGLIEDVPLRALMDNKRHRFAAVSLLVGLREPDTDGHSVSDLTALRSIHGDPTPRSQYAHSLRSKEDQGPPGDLQALVGTRDYVRDQLSGAAALMALPGPSQIVETFLYVEHYGRIEVEVWGPAYRLGLALHALQDSFSHSIRSASGVHILHVLNFINAFDGSLEKGDGLAHSSAMDQCDKDENERLVGLAEGRSLAMVSALLHASVGDAAPIETGLSDCRAAEVGDPECGWFAYEPSCQTRVEAGENLDGTCCSEGTDFCDSQDLETVLEAPTQPYLKEAFGCSTGRASPGGRLGWFVLLLGALRVRRRRAGAESDAPYARSRTVGCRSPGGSLRAAGALCFALLLSAPGVRAQEGYPATAVVRLEAHGSLLTDAARESLLNVSYGPGLRGGYRWTGSEFGQFGLFGLVERDAWYVSDFESRVDPGVLHLGVGGEWLYYGCLRSAMSFGPSILLFDTGLHESGNVGIYAELHPLGIQWNFLHRWALTVDPLSVAWVNPTPEFGQNPSVGHLQYRTTMGLEWRAIPQRRRR